MNDAPEAIPELDPTELDRPAQPREHSAARWLTRAVDLVASNMSAFLLVALMTHIMINVATRTLLRLPFSGTLEITQYWYMPIMALMGIVTAQVNNENLRADLLFGRFPRSARKYIAIGTNILCAALSVAFMYFSWSSAMTAFDVGRTAGISGITVWPAHFVAPVAFALLAVVYIAQLFLPGLSDVDHAEDSGRDEAAPTEKTRSPLLPIALILVVVVTGVLMVLPGMQREGIGLAGIVMMLALLFLRVPIAVALIVPSVIAMWSLRGFRAVDGLLSEIGYLTVASWSLTVIPMFVFMGLLVWKAGLSADVYSAARNWLGWLPGGLAVGTNFAGAGLAAVSGSTTGTTYALGRIGIPEMLRAGYHPRFAIASIMVAGLPGQLIPPSILLVIYAGIAETQIGPQLLAGVLPGVLIALMFGVVFAVFALVRPTAAGRGPRNRSAEGAPSQTLSMGDRVLSLGKTWPMVLIILLVFVGMFSGVVTATEVGAAAALLAFLIAIGKRRKDKPFSVVSEAAITAAQSTGAIFFLIIGGMSLTRMLTMSGVSRAISDGIIELGLDRVQFLLLMILVYLIMGMFLDPLAMMLLTVPILMPTLSALDISYLWFGVFVVFLGEIAILTPPVGMLSYIVYAIVQHKDVSNGMKISLRDVFMSVVWLIPIAVIFLLLLIFFPEIATIIPENASTAGSL